MANYNVIPLAPSGERPQMGAGPVIPRCGTSKGITGAVRYVLGESRDARTAAIRHLPKNGKSRVAWFGGTGFGFEIETREDADLARRIKEFDALNQASRTRPCVKDCVHLSLNWRPGEKPTQAQIIVDRTKHELSPRSILMTQLCQFLMTASG
jgi:hypothetical protein